jgi:diaminopimelate decarboxylase
VKLEPGRYVVAECGVLLGTVNAVKFNGERCFAGTDVGFNVLPRPVIYGSHHDIELYRPSDYVSAKTLPVSVVGNICESGDILAKNALLPEPHEGDIIAILDTGAYCFSMASTYNQRPLPAEVLITTEGKARLIRRRQTPEELLAYLD